MAGPASPFKDHGKEQRLFLSRVIAAAVVVLALTGLLIGRLIELQIVDHQRFSDLSQGNRLRIEPLPPTRGMIFDRNGIVVAENVPTWQLMVIPEQVSDLQQTLQALEELELLDPSERDVLTRLVRSHRGFERVKLRNLSESQAATFAVRRHHFPGVDIQEGLVRYYPFGEVAAHAVGYVGSIDTSDLERIDRRAYAATPHIGKTGVERSYEDVLHGTVGYRQQIVTAQGRVLIDNRSHPSAGRLVSQGGLETRWPLPGNHLVTSLDMRVQLAAFEALEGLRGAAVAIDPRNGDVLALVSTPSFDPNRFAEGLSRGDFVTLSTDPDRPLFNRALAGHYPPGSTVKPFLGVAALYHESLDPHDHVTCHGRWFLPGRSVPYRDWRPQGHGRVDLRQAIIESCNVYFYQLAVGLGIDDLGDFLKRFGLGAHTGLDIMGENAGLIPSREWKRTQFSRREDQAWFPGETVIAGIGQGYMLVTPIQLAHATAVLGARGKRFSPRLVLGTEDAIDRDVVWFDPGELQGIEGVAEEDWELVHNAAVGVTSAPGGTARTSMLGTEYRVAGKTGTSQLFGLAADERYREDDVAERLRDQGLFIAYAPAEDPRIAVAVVVENMGGGGRSAAPVTRKILDAFFATQTVSNERSDSEDYVARQH
jgi:penicillin-binding protein 2